MARLHKNPYPGNWEKTPDETYEAYSRRINELEKTIPWEKVMTFPVADGNACYFVVSEQPFVLQHIPIHDAWTIPASHIRGLRLTDWKMQQRAKLLFK